ncbi:MAG: hypothetical protein HY904_15490 [Deltaproteobacteria bacterium]|nr:hypothetical protein [Deltaproteobacteria bacterium]
MANERHVVAGFSDSAALRRWADADAWRQTAFSEPDLRSTAARCRPEPDWDAFLSSDRKGWAKYLGLQSG